MLTAEQIHQATGHNQEAIAKHWPEVRAEMVRHGVAGDIQEAIMAATISVESHTWEPRRELDGTKHEHRLDLGNFQIGDGHKFRAGGRIQLTGRHNYAKYGKLVGVDLEHRPELIQNPEVSTKVDVAYFKDHGMDVWANRYLAAIKAGQDGEPELQRLRRLVNGGLTHYELFKKYVNAMQPKKEQKTSHAIPGPDKGPSDQGRVPDSDPASVSDLPGIREGSQPTIPSKGTIRRGRAKVSGDSVPTVRQLPGEGPGQASQGHGILDEKQVGTGEL